MITGAHSILYSTNADADRAFLRDVLGFPGVDAGEGWLIFGLPPAEVAVHPGDNDVHELYLMCDDVESLVATLRGHDVACEPPQDRGWGILTGVTLPGGGKLGIYQPRHARPAPMGASKKPARRKPAPKKKRAVAKKKHAVAKKKTKKGRR
jgi:hypothetical protein